MQESTTDLVTSCDKADEGLMKCLLRVRLHWWLRALPDCTQQTGIKRRHEEAPVADAESQGFWVVLQYVSAFVVVAGAPCVVEAIRLPIDLWATGGGIQVAKFPRLASTHVPQLNKHAPANLAVGVNGAFPDNDVMNKLVRLGRLLLTCNACRRPESCPSIAGQT